MRFLIKILFILSFLKITFLADGKQQFTGIIDVLTINKGLSSNNITAIIQDSEGFLWIGTDAGLNRYDGYTFLVFKYNPQSENTITNNYITSLCEDKNGNIWIGTKNGLNLYKKKSKKFVNYISQDDKNSIYSNYILAITCDNENTIWIETDKGLDKYLMQKNLFLHYEHYIDLFRISELNRASLLIDSNKRFWLGNPDGLFYFDRYREIFKRFSNYKIGNILSKNIEISKVFEDHNGNILVGTNEGIAKFSFETGNFQFFYPVLKEKSDISNKITEITEDSRKKIWIGTNDGLYLFLNYSKFIKLDIESFTGIKNFSVTSMKEDKSGILWIGTADDGLIKLNENIIKFNKIELNDLKEYNVNNVNSLIANDSIVLISLCDKGIFSYDRNHENWKCLLSLPNKKFNYINSLFSNIENHLYIGTDRGIYELRINKKNLTVENMTLLPSEELKDLIIKDILLNNKKVLWVATNRGLFFYEKGIFRNIQDIVNDSVKVNLENINCIFSDLNDNLWIGTNEEIIKIDSDLKILPLKFLNNANVRLSIYDFTQTSDNNIWAASSCGIIKINSTTNKIEIFADDIKFPNVTTSGILEGKSNELWVSSNLGLLKFDTKTEAFTLFDHQEGVEDFIKIPAINYKTINGELFFCGKSGINYFFPSEVLPRDYMPKIVFTGLEIFGPKGREFNYINNNDTLIITYNRNYFTIEFAALDYTRPEKCIYAYMMQGLNNDWILIGNNRKATFSNLPAGNYIFKIKATNTDGIWNNESSNIYLIIKAPLWRSRVALVVYVLLFITIVFLIFQYRTRNLREANRILKEKELASMEIARQREELILKNKSITDSIHYAKRIQEAILPSERVFKSYFPLSFIFYAPKDIVSGDFYWVNRVNGKIYVAVADCTGHGVPGAFMSIIGFELLRNITMIHHIEDVSEILNRLNSGLSAIFNVDIQSSQLRDGMDISLCMFDKETNTLEFAGAIHSLIYIKDNKIFEVKGDRYTVGVVSDDSVKFTKNIISLEGIDMIYMFTDGYTDQFGGQVEKKFKLRRFRHLLLTIHKLSLGKQLLFLRETMENWKGNLEQVDDILVIGINPSKFC